MKAPVGSYAGPVQSRLSTLQRFKPSSTLRLAPGQCIAAALVLILLLLCLVGVNARAQSTPRYYDQQQLLYKFSEICSTPLPKGSDALLTAFGEAVKADPKTWQPWMEWIIKMLEKYQKAKCGDA